MLDAKHLLIFYGCLDTPLPYQPCSSLLRPWIALPSPLTDFPVIVTEPSLWLL